MRDWPETPRLMDAVVAAFLLKTNDKYCYAFMDAGLFSLHLLRTKVKILCVRKGLTSDFLIGVFWVALRLFLGTKYEVDIHFSRVEPATSS